MSAPNADQIKLTGYFPGAIGQVTSLHGFYYHENWGFDLSFEAQVARELAEFLMRYRPERDLFWAARAGAELAGSIAIDGGLDPGQGARLRWYIVDPRFQGQGLGARLLEAALDFCRRAGHRRIFLWTFAGLDQARRQYEQAGFALAEEHRAAQWSSEITEQKFDLILND
jgi:GNAT superfamily N-acetyltransferase